MKKPEPVACAVEGCGKTWSRDPVLEVKCPVAVCQAAVGHECTVMKPSGHRLNKNFAHLPPWGHNERELLADREGHYGECPLKRCGVRHSKHLTPTE